MVQLVPFVEHECMIIRGELKKTKKHSAQHCKLMDHSFEQQQPKGQTCRLLCSFMALFGNLISHEILIQITRYITLTPCHRCVS